MYFGCVCVCVCVCVCACVCVCVCVCVGKIQDIKIMTGKFYGTPMKFSKFLDSLFPLLSVTVSFQIAATSV